MKSLACEIKVGRLSGVELSVGTDNIVRIIGDMGCNVNFLKLGGTNILEGNLSEEDLAANVLSRSALLIPFPNRIHDGRYTFGGVTYQLERNFSREGNAIHGLIFNKPFHLSSLQSSEQHADAVFEHEIKEEDFSGYPFRLAIVVKFRLEVGKFTVSVRSTNLSDRKMPYGLGWHPYLRFPGRKVDDLVITDMPNRYLEVNEMIPTGKVLPFEGIRGDRFPLQGVDLDTGFVLSDGVCEKRRVQVENIAVFVDVSGVNGDMKYFQLYTPQGRDSIAVEPMSCPADAFNNGLGLLELEKREEVVHTFGIELI